MKILVGIPAYNVEKTLADVLARVRKVEIVDEVLVVNDGSTDRTGEVLGAAEGIEVIAHPANCGYGAAQKSLCKYFVGRERFGEEDALVIIHGDGEILPEEIPWLVDPLRRDGGIDVVFGSRSPRLARRSGFINRGTLRPLWKRVADTMVTIYLNALFGVRLTTFFGGFRAIRKRALRLLDLDQFGDKHSFDHEILAYLAALTNVFEVPVSNVENDSLPNYSVARNALSVVKFSGRAAAIRRLRGLRRGFPAVQLPGVDRPRGSRR